MRRLIDALCGRGHSLRPCLQRTPVKESRMKRLGILLLTGLCLLTANAAAAQEKVFTKPLKIIVAFGPGSATDVTARILAEHMRPLVGQNVVVENKPGAFGIVAIE